MTTDDRLDLELGNLRHQVAAFFDGPWEMATDPLEYIGPIEDRLDAACGSESANRAANQLSDAAGDSFLAAIACTIKVRAGTGLSDEVRYLLTGVSRDARRFYDPRPLDTSRASERRSPRSGLKQEAAMSRSWCSRPCRRISSSARR